MSSATQAIIRGNLAEPTPTLPSASSATRWQSTANPYKHSLRLLTKDSLRSGSGLRFVR